ncbi:MAG: carbohydrate-binding protein [Ignavibacteriaceae bacterium]
MKKIFLFLLVPFISTFAQNYQLVWSDEFNEPTLDTSTWTFDLGNSGWGNNELENYTNSTNNVYTQNGYLFINARKESNGTYTSGRIKTEGLKSFQYGKIEARMKLPYGQGMWPAFWMLGDNITSVSWPTCGEIDIMEMIGGQGRENTIYGSAHWGGDFSNKYILSSGTFADSFHVYDVTWTPTQIAWHVDGIQYNVLNITPTSLNAFRKPFFIILNLAVGGNWPGNPNSSTLFPQQLVVDYVRDYQNASVMPQINLNSPANNSTYTAFSDIQINANVQYSGAIQKVEFFQGALKIGESDVSPYEMTWRNISPGNYKISAAVTTDSGFQSTSNAVNLTVGSGGKAPYSGNPSKIPGTIYAVNYDLGGQNVGYYNTTSTNNGGLYRYDGVGIESCSDSGGGYDVGWINPGEWLSYTVNVKDSASYNFNFRVASANGGGSFHVEIDGVNVTNSIAVPSTGGWQTWITISANSIVLAKGSHNMKIVFEAGGFNLYKVDIIEPGLTGALQILYPAGGETWQSGSVQEVRWNSYSISDLMIGLSTNDGTNWITISGDAPAAYGFYRFQVPNVSSQNCLIKLFDKNNLKTSAVSAATFNITNTTEVSIANNVVTGFFLQQNYPNPFNPSTTITYSLPDESFVKLTLYNSMGEEIKNLENGIKSAGNYNINFNADNIASGVYFYSIYAKSIENGKEFRSIKKMVLLK